MAGEIVLAKAEDAEEISKLVNSGYRGEYSKQGWTTEADLLDGTRVDKQAVLDIIAKPNTTIIKYVDNAQLLGCAELAIHKNKLYLGMLTVEPTFQGKGIGKSILDAAEDFALENNCKSIYMTVISVRTELIAWYFRHGYINTGEKKPFTFNDSRFGLPRQPLEFVVLEKQLVE